MLRDQSGDREALVTFLLTADLPNRMHLLLLIATVGTHTIVVLGLLAWGAHQSWHPAPIHAGNSTNPRNLVPKGGGLKLTVE